MSRRTNIKKGIVEARDYGRRPFLGKGRFGNMMRTLTDKAVVNVKKFNQSEFKKPYRENEFNAMENKYNVPGGMDYLLPYIPIPDVPGIVTGPSMPGSGGVWSPNDSGCSCTGGGCCDPTTGIAHVDWTCSKGKSRWYSEYTFGDRCAKATFTEPVMVNLCAGECCDEYALYKCGDEGDSPTACGGLDYTGLECSDSNVEEITPPATVVLSASGGLPRYSITGGGGTGWTFEGPFSHGGNSSPSATLKAAANACGSGWVQFTDKCGNSARCSVRSTIGVWNDDPTCTACGERNNGAYHEEGECRTKQGYSGPCTGGGTAGDCPGCFAANPCTATCGVCVPTTKPLGGYAGSYPCWYLVSGSASCHQYCYCPICTGASGIVSEKFECA